MYTHVATHEGPIAARNALTGAGELPSYPLGPDAVFTDPEVASVGLTLAGAQAIGMPVVESTFPFARNGKARALGETDGFVRIVVDRHTRRMAGAVVVGHHAADVMPEILVALAADGTIAPIRAAIHIHPTLSEAVNSAARSVEEALAAPS